MRRRRQRTNHDRGGRREKAFLLNPSYFRLSCDLRSDETTEGAGAQIDLLPLRHFK
jgi:hypothetical protein